MVDLEAYMDAALASLQSDSSTGLAARIAAVNAAATDDLVVPDVEVYSTGADDPIGRYPLVEVAPPGFSVDGIDLASLTAALAFPMIVRAQIEHPVPESLQRITMRMQKAILDCLLQPRAFDDARVLAVSGTFGFNAETEERARFIGSTVLVFTLAGAGSRSTF